MRAEDCGLSIIQTTSFTVKPCNNFHGFHHSWSKKLFVFIDPTEEKKACISLGWFFHTDKFWRIFKIWRIFMIFFSSAKLIFRALEKTTMTLFKQNLFAVGEFLRKKNRLKCYFWALFWNFGLKIIRPVLPLQELCILAPMASWQKLWDRSVENWCCNTGRPCGWRGFQMPEEERTSAPSPNAPV